MTKDFKEWRDQYTLSTIQADHETIVHAAFDAGYEAASVGLDQYYNDLSQKYLASIKRDTRVSFEDAAVRAAHTALAEFNPDWHEKAVLVEEMQRVGKELQEHFKLGYDAGVLETQLDQAKERNFCPRCGKRLDLESSVHTCTPPARGQMFYYTPRTFDDYGNKIV